MLIEELTNEERELMNQLEHVAESPDEPLPNIEDNTKAFIKNVIRYGADHYEVKDPKTEDPIIISDTDIDVNMDFLVNLYNDMISIPYLDMYSNLTNISHTRKLLKNNELLLYARKEFARVDLGMDDDYVSDLAAINTSAGDIIDYSKIKADSKENDANIKKTDASKLLIEYLIKMRYGGKDMSQIDLIIEKLTYDIERLTESTDLNKKKNIEDTRRAINIISNIGSETDIAWDEFLRTAIVTDKRALNLAKEMDKNPKQAKKYIDTIFGPQMTSSFVHRLIRNDAASVEDYTENTYAAESGALLLLYTLAKKVESCMKSRDCRSLIYRGYIIHYMLDYTDSDGLAMSERPAEYFRMYTLFTDIINKYFMYTPYNILKNNKFHDELI